MKVQRGEQEVPLDAETQGFEGPYGVPEEAGPDVQLLAALGAEVMPHRAKMFDLFARSGASARTREYLLRWPWLVEVGLLVVVGIELLRAWRKWVDTFGKGGPVVDAASGIGSAEHREADAAWDGEGDPDWEGPDGDEEDDQGVEGAGVPEPEPAEVHRFDKRKVGTEA